MPAKISILMLTHNAPEFVELAISTINTFTHGVDYELVVVDNDSRQPTRDLLQRLLAARQVGQCRMLDYNSLFAAGNNIAAGLAAADATHFLLLNSDVEILHPAWLNNLLSTHQKGISAYGVVSDPLRVDGWCLLIDAPIYRRHRLDENYQWWWAVTKLQAAVLSDGYWVRGHADYGKYLHHFGGKSGMDFQGAKGMDVTPEEARSWFGGRTIQVIDR